MPFSLIAARVRRLVVVTRNVADFVWLGVEALNPFVTALR